MAAGNSTIPLTVLTGFLGSGKTTLLSRQLRSPALARTAVIINEMGEIGLDHDLVRTASEDLIELTTGCLCCKARGDLAVTLADLIARRDRGEVMAFERIVLETSGIADPAPILQLTMVDRGLAERVSLAGVVTTVDCMTGAATLRREAQAGRQVAVADRLVLTKSDMAGGVPVSLVDDLARINPAAEQIVARFGDIDGERLFDAIAPGAAKSIDDLAAWVSAQTTDGRDAEPSEQVSSLSIVLDAPLHAVTLTLLAEALAEHSGADLLRLKGLVELVETPGRPAVIHGVQHVFHPIELLAQWPSDDHRSRLVLIGRRLHRGWVEALIAAIEAEMVASSRQPGSQDQGWRVR